MSSEQQQKKNVHETLRQKVARYFSSNGMCVYFAFLLWIIIYLNWTQANSINPCCILHPLLSARFSVQCYTIILHRLYDYYYCYVSMHVYAAPHIKYILYLNMWRPFFHPCTLLLFVSSLLSLSLSLVLSWPLLPECAHTMFFSHYMLSQLQVRYCFSCWDISWCCNL